MKSDYFEQKLKALLANKEFKQAVIDFRKEWKLPAEGLAVNETVIKNWLSEILFGKEKPRFFEASIIPSLTSSIREYEALLQKGLFEGGQEKVFSLESAIFPLTKEFNQKIKGILTKFSLPYTYFEYIRRYLIINDLHYLPDDKVKIIFERRTNKRIGLLIEIFPDTTGKDIMGKLDDIKKAQKELFGSSSGRQRGKYDFERDLMIYALREQGLSAEEVRSKLKERFGSAPLYNEIHQIYRRFKKTYFGKK